MKKSYYLAGAAILIWSTVATISKIMLGSFSQYQLLCISAFFAAFALFLFNLFTGKLKKVKQYTKKEILLMVGTGLCGNFFYYICYYSGTRLMPTSIAFIINYLWPVMSVVFACIILKEKFTIRKIIAFVFSFAGVIIVSGGSILTLDVNMLIGTVLCLLGAAFYGAFTALNKKFQFDITIMLMFSFLASFILSLLINVVLGINCSVTIPQIIGFAWNGVFCMAIGSLCWTLAVNRGNTAKISNLAYITPFLSLLWVFVFLQEPLAPTACLGFGVIILGIVIQMKER